MTVERHCRVWNGIELGLNSEFAINCGILVNFLTYESAFSFAVKLLYGCKDCQCNKCKTFSNFFFFHASLFLGNKLVKP
jgi:hypothetical protein